MRALFTLENRCKLHELYNNNQMKTIVNFGMYSDFKIFVKEMNFLCFFYFLGTENTQGLADHE